jgi:hypothetical protein
MHRRAAQTFLAALVAALLLPATAAGDHIGSTSAQEGDALEFEVGLSLSPTPYDPQPGTATEGVDFDGEEIATAGPGNPAEVPTVEDDVDEPDETVRLVQDGHEGIGTIIDDDPAPTLSIADVAADESAGVATVTLSASNPSARDIVVPLTGVDVFSSAADYAVPPSVTLPAGMRSVSFAVTLTNDTEDEIDEIFLVRLGTAEGAQIGDGEAIVTIVNDDLRVVDVDDASTPEGDGGQSIARFTIRLNGPTFRRVTVRYATTDGLASAPSDYLSRLGTVTFEPGQVTAVVDVPVIADDRREAAEAFALRLTEVVNARPGKTVAVGVIVDDDGGANTDTSDVMPPEMRIGAPKVRGRRVTMRVTCPRGERRCAGRITLFTVADRRSRSSSLRRERRLGAKSFRLGGGRSRTVAVTLSSATVRAARRAGRLKVQAFAVTQDAGGNVDTRTRRATLRYRRR